MSQAESLPGAACPRSRFAGPSGGSRHRLLWVLLPLFAWLFGAAPAAAQSERYAAFVMDAASGEVFHAVQADRPLYPASLTKMMTLYLTFQALAAGELTLDTAMPVSAHAAGQPPSKLGLPTGGRLKVEDAILALVTKSANDAAVVLAETLGGSESAFARQMTQQAAALGMTRTVFRNASGLPDTAQVSTARDMALLARALIVDFPQYYGYFSTRSFRWNGRVFENHNRILDTVAGADGLKTGYIRASGYNLAASAIRGGRRFIAVVFGGETIEDRNTRVAALLESAFAASGGTGEYVVAVRPAAPPVAPVAPPRLVDASPIVDTAGAVAASANGLTDPMLATPTLTGPPVAAGVALRPFATGVAVATAPPPFLPPLPPRRPGTTVLEITVAGPAPPDAIATILAATTAPSPLPDTIEAQLVEASGGAALPPGFGVIPIPRRLPAPRDPVQALLLDATS